ncbi:L-2,4-diaminobutyric acid acetyltransferase [Longimycelium tulufanense]|uniref:L-2,4-diaminobutyric acid acetyltransferase n=1 Tax=Longimycelium tulufanense TaxID=907463 RepID=A0A8J3FVG7_9PSEU|nr:diaminobutyrate acetyltransferase [Longimycelium tulufanense]GGM44223.1 L-2,4-diaminobutyric acid acetyltransferase [Longimycelium tulufanense]
MTGERPDRAIGGGTATPSVLIEQPGTTDGAEMWRIARDSQTLDLNPSYAYLLWCRDFSVTSAVARVDGTVAGFVTGYLRPDAPDTLVVWQIAVDAQQRGHGLAGRLLRHLLARLAERGVRFLETTITADNTASIALFSALARDLGTTIERRELFDAAMFPDGHAAEDLYRIGPIPS